MGDTDAFKNNGKFDVAALNASDSALNKHAFSNAGDTGGLNYNIFCSGNVALADGRWLFIGGHDKTGPAGIAKLLLFDPETQTWADRGLYRVTLGRVCPARTNGSKSYGTCG